MAGGLPSLSSLVGGTSSGGYVDHYASIGDPFKITKSAIAAAKAKAAAASEAHHHSSVFGDIAGVGGNLLGDIKNTAEGAIPGLINMAEHPVSAGKAVIQDYRTRYGKILHGDFSDVAAHPLSYILDAATVASGGLGAAAKVGELGKVADAAAAGSRSAKILTDLGRARETGIALKRGTERNVPLSLSSNPYTRMRQRAILKLQEMPGVAKAPVFGSESKARRTLVTNQRAAEAAVRNTQPAFERAVKKMTTAPEVHVFDLVARGTTPAGESAFYRHPLIAPGVSEPGHELLGHLAHPATHQLYGEVTNHLLSAGAGKDPFLLSTKHLSTEGRRVVEALKQHKKLTDQATHLLISTGKLTKAGALDRRVAHLQLHDRMRIHDIVNSVRGLKQQADAAGLRVTEETAKHPEVRFAQHLLTAAHAAKVGDVIDRRMMESKAGKLVKQIHEAHGRVADLLASHPAIHEAVANVAKLHLLGQNHMIPKAVQNVEDVIGRVRSHLNETHIHPLEDQQGLNTLLLHDHHALPADVIARAEKHLQSTTERVHGQLYEQLHKPLLSQIQSLVDEGKTLHGKKATDYMAEAKARTGILPQYVPDKMVLGDTGKGTFKGTLYKTGNRHPNPELSIMRHEQAANIASLAHAHAAMRKAGVHLPDGGLPNKHWTWLNEHAPAHDYIGLNLDRFSKESQKLVEGGKVDPRKDYFDSLTQGVAPTKVENRIAVPKTLAQDMVDRHLRIQGTIGDMLHKGTSMWKAMILAYRPAFLGNNMIGNQALYHLRQGIGHKGWALRALGTTKRDRPALEDILNEHNQTFGHSERFLSKGKAAQLGNLQYRLVGRHELYLRTATMRAHALKIPEVRQAMRTLKGGTYDPARHGGKTIFHEALTRAIKKNPAIRDEISRVIDDTMGNYRYYNRFEEGLRQLIPFYGWSRHSVRSFQRLMADRPALVQGIQEGSHKGNQLQQKEFPGVPDFMRSYLPFHHLGQNAIDTRAWNPLLAASDTVQGAKEAVQMKAGKMDAATSMLNPLLVNAIQSISHTNLTTGAPLPKTAFDHLPLGEFLGQTLEGLPQARIAQQLAGTVNPNKKSARYQLTPTGRQAKHKTPMLSHDNTNLVASLLGASLKNVNLKAAQEYQKKLAALDKPHFHAATPRKKKLSLTNVLG